MRIASVSFAILVFAVVSASEPPAEFPPLEQSIYGSIIVVPPAQRLAMIEANRSMYATDPLVAREAIVLSQLTAGYVEDAPRIAELTIRATQAIRATNRPASPLEIMNAALRWTRPGGNVPREYERYVAIYRALRVRGKADHAQAAAKLNMPPAPAPPPVIGD